VLFTTITLIQVTGARIGYVDCRRHGRCRGGYSRDLASDDLYRQIRRLKGFGDYAAESVLRLLGRHDTLGIDSVARDTYRTRFNNGDAVTDAAIRAHYGPVGVWRGLVMWMDVIAPEEPS